MELKMNFFIQVILGLIVGIILLNIECKYFGDCGDEPPPIISNINYDYHDSHEKQFKQLQQGEILHSGDYYKITFKPNFDSYVYIFQKDSVNKIYKLFPMTEFQGKKYYNLNPVKAGATYQLPSKNGYFVLDKQTGTESIYFIIKNQQDPILEKRATITEGDFMQRRKGLATIANKLEWQYGVHVLNFEHR
jgi:hypothetical protein